MLNKALFDHRNVEVLGVIINKVLPEKYDKVNDLVRRGLKRKGIDVFGVIPHYPALSSPTIKQIVEDTKGTLLCGETELERVVGRILIGAMPPTTALDYLKGDVLLIAPGNREDLLITSMIGKALNVKEKYNVQGIVLTGDILPHPRVLELLKQSNIPVISVKEDTYEMARKINKMVVKIKPYDKEKIETVKSMTKEYVNTDLLLEKLITSAEKTA
jgi:BioD-like phosphotransacetylase family protein